MGTESKKMFVVLVVWMGKFPASFTFWLMSAKKQPFDFVFITDQDQPIDCECYKWIKLNIDELREKISGVVNFDVSLSFPYKICDYRPAFGEIFSEIVKDYHYWGHCDLDMVFGNTQIIKDKAKTVFIDKIMQTGVLSFFRNTPQNNSLYRENPIIDYRYIFTTTKYCMFDEWHGIERIMKEHGREIFHEELEADIDPNSLYFTPGNITSYRHQIFVYNDGDVIQYYLEEGIIKTRSLLFIHFQKRKIDFSAVNTLCNSYIFNSKKIIPMPATGITKREILKYNTPDFTHFFKRFWDRVRIKIYLKDSIFDQYVMNYKRNKLPGLQQD